MKKPAKVLLGAVLGVAMVAGGAAASDIEDGDQLVAACQALLDGGSAPETEGEPCKDFLVGMVTAQQETLTLGEPFRALRIGPDEDETACFELPDKLSYREFAMQTVSYAGANPQAAERPAYELATRALEAKYPCDPEDLKEMEKANSPKE